MDFRKKSHILRISPILFLLWAGFIYSYAQDIPKTTKITISISGPVEYQHYIKEDPLAIVIEFKSKNVFSYWEGVMQVNRGVIKEIHTEYYLAKKNELQPVKFLTFILSQKVPYNISQTNNAIIIEVENPSVGTAEIPSGEIVISGKFETELEIQKKEVLDRTLLEAKQKLEEPKKNFSGRQDTKSTVTQTGVLKGNSKRGKLGNKFFYFLIFPVVILWGGYFLLRKRTKKVNRPGIAKEPASDLSMEKTRLQQELEKLKEEKLRLENKLAEKENLEKRLIDIELLESQLRKAKTDLEETNSLRQQLEEKLKIAEKQRVGKDIQQQQLLKDTQERELNLRNELKTKEELIKQLSDERESLKIEMVKMNIQLKKEVNMREELEKNLKEKEKAMEILSATTIEKMPKEEILKEARIGEQLPEEKRKSPRLELTPLGDRGILLRLATSNKDEPYLIGVVKNVSSGGIMAELDKELPSFDSVNMDLIEHGSFSPIGVLGKIIWQKQDEAEKFRVGMSFISISEDNQKRINEYISKIETLSTNNP